MPEVIVNWKEEAERMERISQMWVRANVTLLIDEPNRCLNALGSMAKQLSLLCSARAVDVHDALQAKT